MPLNSSSTYKKEITCQQFVVGIGISTKDVNLKKYFVAKTCKLLILVYNVANEKMRKCYCCIVKSLPNY